MSNYQYNFNKLGKAEAGTKVLTMNMVRNAMNGELQNQVELIQKEYLEQWQCLSPAIKKRIEESRKQIIEDTKEETGSREYAVEKEFASWSELIWAIAASNPTGQPSKLAANS